MKNFRRSLGKPIPVWLDAELRARIAALAEKFG